MSPHRQWAFGLLGAVAVLGALIPGRARGHCDGLDGPVVSAARGALESGDVTRVLIWVQPADEDAVRRAHAAALRVRQLGPDAQALADMAFFETVVRLHRAGEGASYTGLKPAGRDLGPAIPAADRALAAGNVDEVTALLTHELQRGLAEQFARVEAAKHYAPNDVSGGRRFVAAYVQYVHYVEGLYEAAHTAPVGHYAEGARDVHAHQE